MPLQSSPATMSLSDIYQNINETGDTMPSSNSDVSLLAVSELMENASQIGPTSRANIGADPRAFSEFYGYHYPGGFSQTQDVYYLGHPTTTPLTNNTLVEGEDLGVTFEHITHDGDDKATVSIVESDGTAATGDDTDQTFSDDAYGAYSDAIDSVLLTVGSYEGATMRVKVVDYANSYDSNLLSDTFTYRDSIAGHGVTTLTNSVGGGSYNSTTVTAADQSINNIIVVGTVTTGTQASVSYGVSTLINGDGGNMGASDAGEDWAVANTPGKIRFTSTHVGAGTSGGRNQTTSTADFDCPYAYGFDSLTINDTTINQGAGVFISGVSEGGSGTITYGYGPTGNTTFTDSTTESCTDANHTKYERQSFGGGDPLGTFTFSTPGSYVVKAKTTSPSTVVEGTAFVVAPTISFSKTANQTINISGTQNFAVTSPTGNNFACTISSNSAGNPSTTDHATGLTVAPLLANGVYTITFSGESDYGQTSTQTSTLTVRPTVSLAEGSSQTSVMGYKTTYSTGLKPKDGYDVTAETLSFTATPGGDTITSSGYTWTIPAGFSDQSETDSTLSGTFTSNLSGTESKTFGVTSSGNGATSTQATVSITTNPFVDQAASSLVITVGSGGWVSTRVVRRGSSNAVNIAFSSTNLKFVNIVICWTGTETNPLVDEDIHEHLDTTTVNAKQTLTVTTNTSVAQAFDVDIPDVGALKLGLYDIYIRDHYVDGSSYLPDLRTTSETITVIDKLPTTPGAWTTTSGGYSGDQSVAWSASTYAATYKIQRSANNSTWGDWSTSSTNSKTITANANSTLNYYYKVAAVNDNSTVDLEFEERAGGAATSNEVSGYNSSRQFIVYPTITNSKNTINPATNTIYTTLNNSTGVAMTFSSPGNATDNVTAYAYTDDTALWTISNGTTATATITAAGTSTGTGVVTLSITGNGGTEGDQSSSTTTTIACYHRWDITDVVMTQATFKVGLDTVTVDSFNIQGYSKTSSTAIQVDASLVDKDTGSIVGPSNAQWTGIADSHLTQQSVTTNDSFGIIEADEYSAGGTVRVRFTVSNESQSGPAYEYSGDITVVSPSEVYHRASVLSGTVVGDNNAEDASLDVATGSPSLYIFGNPDSYGTSISNGVQFYYKPDDNYEVVDADIYPYFEIRTTGGGFVAGDVVKLHTNGKMTDRWATADVPPKTPGTPTYSHTTTGASFTGGMNFSNYTYGSPPALVELTGKSTTKTVRVSWADNSAINDSYSVTFNGSTATGESGTATYKDYSGLTNGAYAGATVTAVHGTSTAASTQGATTTVANDGTIYFAARHNAGGTWTNLGTTTGTDFQMTGTELLAGAYTVYAKYGSYPSSTSGNIDSDALTVTAGTMTFEIQNVIKTAISAGNASEPEAEWFYFGNPWDGAPDEGEFTTGDSCYLNLQTSGITTSGVTIGISVSSGAIGTVAVNTESTGTSEPGGASGWSSFGASKTGDTHASSAYRTFICLAGSSGFLSGGGTDVFTLTATETGYTTKTIAISMEYDEASGGGNGGEGICFVAGTLITMSDYSTKKIEEIVVGDVVLSYNRSTSEISTAIVEELQSPTHKHFVDVEFGSFKNTNTYDHPYYVVGKGLCSYRPDLTEHRYGLTCSQLDAGDVCLVLDGTSLVEVTVLDIIVRDVEVQTSYNLDTEELDMYFANGVLVHNKG